METPIIRLLRSAKAGYKIFICCTLLAFSIQENRAQVPIKPGIKLKAKLPPENLSGQLLANAQYNFSPSNLKNAVLSNPTSLQFGPDGRLYVSQLNGLIKIFTVVRNGANNYSATSTETISLINSIPNHNDDGTLNTNVKTRQVTGILVTGTASQPILYVGSSDSRMGGGSSKGDINLDTNSGIISRLTKTGSGWQKVDLVRGLPRSEENHSVNGMQLDRPNNRLYLVVGGFTNSGGPSNNFGFINEYALSAAILSIDLDVIEAMPTKGSGNTAYKYDLPTLNDPTRPNNPDGTDQNDPFGGNDGLNQARIVPGGPVRIFSPGYRNAYDFVITKTPGKEGRMYTIDNGANQGWGGHPDNEGADGTVTNKYVIGEPGSTGPGPNDPKVNNLDNLHYIGNLNNYLPGSYYAGHPAPTRANPAGAGLYTHNGTTGVWRSSLTGGNPLPADWPPLPLNMANPIEGDFQNPGETDLAILTFANSTNGIVEYTASNFNNSLKGTLLAADYGGYIHKITLTSNGSDVTNPRSPTNKLNQDLPFAAGFGSNPLDITAQGDGEIFPGSVWAASYGANSITIFEPNDFLMCSGNYSTTLDDDNDCFSNADEIDNGTNPCSAASKPLDFDQNCISDLNDPDDDNDGLADNIDYFAIDSRNGRDTNLPLRYDLFNNDPGTGFFGLGFTGLMSNKKTGNDYINLFDEANLIAGGAVGAFSIVEVTSGDALGTLNNQENAFQFGVNINAGTGPFTYHAGMLGPFFDNQIPQNHQSQGIYIGTGDQDNYLKIVMNANGGSGGIEVVVENAGQPSRFQYPLGGGIPDSSLDLFLDINPAQGTVQAKYARDGGPQVSVGTPISVSGELLAAMQGTPALAFGIIATSRQASTFTATWDILELGEAPGNAGEATRINAGGGQVNAFGTTFEADQYFSGGTTYTNNNITNIAGTTHDALYSSERYGSFSYNVPVPSGTYTVRLHFAEVWFGATGGGSGGVGKRVFNVTGEGQALLTNFDIYAEVGSMTALVKEFQVSVSDGTMNLGFVTVVDNAKVAAIEIRANSGTANLEPIAKAGPEQTVTAGANGLASVQLAGSGSSDPDGTIASYVWKEGNTQLGTGATPTVSLAVGTHNITLTVTDNQGATDTDQVMVTVKSLETTTATRINSGGAQVAAFGATFVADQYFSGGTTYTNNNITNIAGTTHDALYSSERFGTFSYNVPVPSGTYTVRLHFAEVWFGATGGGSGGVGKRVFNVTGEGQALLTNFDIYAEVGSMTALVKEFQVSVSDGTLNLSFSPKVDNAKVAAIEIRANSGTANLEPIAKAGPDQTVTAGANGLASVQLAGSGSSDPDGTIASYVWKEGNTQLATGATPTVSLAVGTYNITLTVTDNQGATDTDQVMVTVKSLETTAIRINTGGPQVAAFGSTFVADQYFSSGPKYTNTKITNIAGTTYDELYKSERYGTFSYNVPVPSGTYTVRLHFAEVWFGATGGGSGGVGKRVFNVTGEGQALLTNFDIYAEVGSMTALVKEFQVSVSDGTLNLSFSPKVNNAKISALEVLSSSGVNLRIGENQNISDHKIQSITPETIVPMENGGVVNVNPNPFEDIINLHFQKEEPQNYEIRVYDVAGRIYFQGTFSSKSAEKSIYPINLANKSLATGGMYLVFIESENGKFMKIFKMIKK